MEFVNGKKVNIIKDIDIEELYAKESTKSELLTPKEEIMLAKKIQLRQKAKIQLENMKESGIDIPKEIERKLQRKIDKGEIAKEKFIKSNLKLVMKFAYQYKNYGVSYLDLIQEGNFGLIKAVEKFNPYAGVKFVTYASYWIKKYIFTALQKHGRNIKLPISLHESIREIKKVEEELSQKLKRKPYNWEIAEELDVEPEEIDEARMFYRYESSLNFEIDDFDRSELQSTIVNEASENPENELFINVNYKYLTLSLEKLLPYEQNVIKKRFGIDCDEHTLKELAEELNLSEERVRQIQNKAIRKMYKIIEKLESTSGIDNLQS